MKFFLFINLFALSCFTGLSQSLAGEWSGSYTDDKYDSYPLKEPRAIPIKLYFVLNKNSSYNVYSYSSGYDTTVVCEVEYKWIGEDSIYLKEKKILLPKKITPSNFQKMFLKFHKKKNTMYLRGEWECVDGKTWGSGTIRFYKKDK